MQGIDLVFQIAILIMSVVIHEVSHGFSAYLLGDPTAKYAGRLSLNPIKHLDLFGSVLLPLVLVLTGSPYLIGWAKPVPYNPYNLRNQKWGPTIVGLAGPAANFFLVLIFGLILRFGSAGFLPESFLQISGFVVLINLILMAFNLTPIPPLDGSKLLFAILPYQWRGVQYFLERYGFFVLIIVVFIFGGLYFGYFLFPIVGFLFQLITGLGF